MNSNERHIMSTIHSTETEALAAEYHRLKREARDTPCGFENCDGTGHEIHASTDEWFHRVVHEMFDGRVVELDITATPAGVYKADLLIEGEGSDLTAADLRKEADLYDSYPALLRRMADRMDELNKASA
jgi:hypothetical protein